MVGHSTIRTRSAVVRGRLVSLSRHACLPGCQPVLPVAVHRDHARAALARGSSLFGGMPARCRLCPEEPRHGGVDHAVREPLPARDRCGVADPRLRPYWRPTQVSDSRQPRAHAGDPGSREAMHWIINNADGVCNIDSTRDSARAARLAITSRSCRRAGDSSTATTSTANRPNSSTGCSGAGAAPRRSRSKVLPIISG